MNLKGGNPSCFVEKNRLYLEHGSNRVVVVEIKVANIPSVSPFLLFLAIMEQLENCPIRSPRKTISSFSMGR